MLILGVPAMLLVPLVVEWLKGLGLQGTLGGRGERAGCWEPGGARRGRGAVAPARARRQNRAHRDPRGHGRQRGVLVGEVAPEARRDRAGRGRSE